MQALFGKKKTPEQMLRQHQRTLNKSIRDLDRERQKMENQEKKVINDIKKMAKEGQMDAVKIMAKDLVRTRRYVKKFILMKANMQAVSLKIQFGHLVSVPKPVYQHLKGSEYTTEENEKF